MTERRASRVTGMVNLPKRLAGRYEPVRRVGTGGMADVYLARDTLLGRQVALKILHPQYASDESFVERFRREARAAANLQHPNIVSIYDEGQQGNVHFMVMEYVEGRSLKDVIAAEAPMPPRRAASIALQVLDALEYAHRSGLVHRDVKPGNILLASSGDARVTDFGIARASDGDSMTQTGTILGTAYYLSPEQAQGLDVDARADLYSLGVVLYEMVTGARPVEGESPYAIAYAHVRGDVPRPSSVKPGVPASLEAVIMKALAKSRDARYSSAAAMHADVQAYAEGRQVTAVLPTRTPSGEDTQVIRTEGLARRTSTSRPGWALALALGLLVGGLALGAVSAVALLRERIGQSVVPSIANRPFTDAERLLRARGLDPSFQGNEPSDTVAEGRVTRQRPVGRSRVAGGSTVKFWVSSGLPVVVVPEVRTMNRDLARRQLEAYGLTVGDVTEVFDAKPAGTVLDQNPRANSQVRKGWRINLTVSKGAETAPVPDVTGHREDDAITLLAEAGFRVERFKGPSGAFTAGYVYDQEPKGGSAAEKGSAVSIYTSTGTESFAMPDVTGSTEAAATDQLEQLGLVVEVERVTAPSPSQRGRVVSQAPDPETTVRRGERVQIQVGE